MSARTEETHRALAAAIRQRRRSLGLTLEALEESCGVSAAFIGQIERAVKKPSIATLERIAAGLDVRLEELLRASAPLPSDPAAEQAAAILRGHTPVEREFLLDSLRDLSRRLKSLPRPPRE